MPKRHRGGAAAARRACYPDIAGSTPAPGANIKSLRRLAWQIIEAAQDYAGDRIPSKDPRAAAFNDGYIKGLGQALEIVCREGRDEA